MREMTDATANLLEAARGVAFMLDAMRTREDMQNGEAEALAMMAATLTDATEAFEAEAASAAKRFD